MQPCEAAGDSQVVRGHHDQSSTNMLTTMTNPSDVQHDGHCHQDEPFLTYFWSRSHATLQAIEHQQPVVPLCISVLTLIIEAA